MADIAKLVDDQITQNSIAVYGKTKCPHTIKNHLKTNGQAIKDYVLRKTNKKTDPYIFINQKHIGGKLCNDELEIAIANGTLESLIKG
ncbi:hypothetical protein G9A89_001014 [Geosiphon pyriformis]|nr:hypothetical protein G9A89_001014 [Geosiphon pyriformis]